MRLIGLHGESRSGKDSVAGVLVREYGFRQVALATKIREILLDIDPWLEDADCWLDDLYDAAGGDWDQIKAKSKDSVEYMIALGQSLRDRISEDIWIDAAFQTTLASHELVVVSDIRQPNEVEWLHSNGGELWKITRPGTEARGMDDLLKGVHFDAHIVNDGSLDHLAETVRWIIEQ